ncbi:hypothetical protein PSFL111601_03330 [Pseudomonas floridensis]
MLSQVEEIRKNDMAVECHIMVFQALCKRFACHLAAPWRLFSSQMRCFHMREGRAGAGSHGAAC